MTGLGDFNTYDLGRVLEALRAEAAERPKAPAAHILRAACTRLLTWDHRYPTCWDDPAYLARYTWLRRQLVGDALAPLGDAASVGDAAAILDSLLNQALAADETTD